MFADKSANKMFADLINKMFADLISNPLELPLTSHWSTILDNNIFRLQIKNHKGVSLLI